MVAEQTQHRPSQTIKEPGAVVPRPLSLVLLSSHLQRKDFGVKQGLTLPVFVGLSVCRLHLIHSYMYVNYTSYHA